MVCQFKSNMAGVGEYSRRAVVNWEKMEKQIYDLDESRFDERMNTRLPCVVRRICVDMDK